MEAGKKSAITGYVNRPTDNADPVLRKNRTVEVFHHEAGAQQKYGLNIVTIKAKEIGPNNYIIIDRKDAYLLSLLQERENQLLFKEARIGVAAQD